MAKGHAKRAKGAERRIYVSVEFDVPMHKKLKELAKSEKRSLRNLVAWAAERLVSDGDPALPQAVTSN